MAPPFPISAMLVPEPRAGAPEGHALINSPILAGLPHRIALDHDTSLWLVVPTGVARPWVAAGPGDVVSSGAADSAAPGQGLPADGRHPCRLVLRLGGRTASVIPLARGLRRRLPDSGAGGAVGGGAGAVDLVILDWLVHAGSVRGPGDFGSYLAVAWSRADRAVDRYSELPPHPHVRVRIPKVERVESEVGLKVAASRRVSRVRLLRRPLL